MLLNISFRHDSSFISLWTWLEKKKMKNIIWNDEGKKSLIRCCCFYALSLLLLFSSQAIISQWEIERMCEEQAQPLIFNQWIFNTHSTYVPTHLSEWTHTGAHYVSHICMHRRLKKSRSRRKKKPTVCIGKSERTFRSVWDRQKNGWREKILRWKKREEQRSSGEWKKKEKTTHTHTRARTDQRC